MPQPSQMKYACAVACVAVVSAAAPSRACDVHLSAGLSAISPVAPFVQPSASDLISGGPSSGLSVPILNSLAPAHAKVYLDFDGDFTPSWHGHTPGQTPAYSIDTDTSNFSP